MTSAQRKTRLSSREFLEHPAARNAAELVRGELRVMTPASGAHGIIAGRIFAAINAFVEPRDLGVCFPDNTGFQLPNLVDTVRSPDVAFIRHDRLPHDGIGTGWVTIAPDLVVEVVSPTETKDDLDEKIRDYRAAGTRVWWIVDPAARTVTISRVDAVDRVMTQTDMIDQIDILPGFSLEVARLFVGLALSSS